ncbi:MAG: hypothetical protein H0U82_08200 [Actinobacteria bacterium]|nr:hypothetical protein [Actinomycetota bacterium]
MGRSAKRKRERRQLRRQAARAATFLRELFSTTPPPDPAEEPPGYVGGLGVREPRRPLRPSSSGAVALEIPPEETRDLWLVGEEDRD